MSAVPLCPLGALGGVKMSPFQCTPGHQHVALGTPFMGKVSLLQNDKSIPDMPMGKMYSHFCTCRRLSQTDLNGTVPRSPGSHKYHPVCSWFLNGGHGFPTQYPLCFPPMLCLHVPRQQPESHLLPAILALNPTPLPLLVLRPCSCRLKLCSLCLA